MSAPARRAVVTGASRGIGREVLRLLLAAGDRVAAVGRSLQTLETAIGGNPNGIPILADLRSQRELEAAAAQVTQQLGAVELIVHAAGVWHDGSERYQEPLLHQTPQSRIDEVLGVGVMAPFTLLRALLPGMVEQRRGKVVFISCGFAGPHEAKGWLHYYVANEAIQAMTRGLAEELRPSNIQVNSVAPWFVATEDVKRFYPDDAGRAVDPTVVARMILQLASPDFDHVSGQVVEIRSNRDY